MQFMGNVRLRKLITHKKIDHLGNAIEEVRFSKIYRKGTLIGTI